MIYFAQAVDGGPIKIGTSTDVGARLSQLEAHYGRPLALLGTAPGGREKEREWHERFAHLRLGRTEQFRPAPELMEAIGRPLLVGANSDAAEAMPGGDGRAIIASMKCTPEFHAWLVELAERDRSTVAQVLEKAAVIYAKHSGFDEPAPHRSARRRDAR